MEKIAVFVDDAVYAGRLLQPMLGAAEPTHWVVVACPPTLTRHVGRWASQPARRAWRERWAADRFDALAPQLRRHSQSRVDTVVADRPLAEWSARLQARLVGVRLLDARAPRLGSAHEPLTLGQPLGDGTGWAGTMAAAGGLTALLALVD